MHCPTCHCDADNRPINYTLTEQGLLAIAGPLG